MDAGLDTLKWHIQRLMEQSGVSTDARAEIEDAMELIQERFDVIDRQLAALVRRVNDLESYHN